MRNTKCPVCDRGYLTLYTRATSDNPRESGRVQCPCCDGTGRVRDVDAHEGCCCDEVGCVAEQPFSNPKWFGAAS